MLCVGFYLIILLRPNYFVWLFMVCSYESFGSVVFYQIYQSGFSRFNKSCCYVVFGCMIVKLLNLNAELHSSLCMLSHAFVFLFESNYARPSLSYFAKFSSGHVLSNIRVEVRMSRETRSFSRVVDRIYSSIL